MTQRRIVLKFDAGKRGFRRIVIITALFALVLLAAGVVVVSSILAL